MKTNHPKIGIRPIIDGRRREIHESWEEKPMEMARSVASLYSENLRYIDGAPVECVIADTTIGGVAEAAACACKFADENVCATLSVTPCWCYGSETIDMDPLLPKAIWGFNGSERPGAVYLAAALAGHNQKGLPAFGIYGKDVQDASDNTIPEDVKEKLLRFARAALAVGQMKGKSYLSVGYCSMGIAGSQVDAMFLQKYLGMRTEYAESVEILRRIELGIYDRTEFEKAMAWTRINCKEGTDYNPSHLQHTREQKEQEWEFVVKMTLIIRDMMIGNPILKEMGYEEEAMGHNAIMGGFQGQRQWTDFLPNGDFSEAILNSSFDWNGIRKAFIVATENDHLNATAMLLGHLLTNTSQLFADVRTYWSPEAIERVTGIKLEGTASNGFIHLINSGSCTLDGSGQMTENGCPVMKPYWEITNEDVQRCLDATQWYPASLEYFRGGGYSSNYMSKGGMPMTMSRINMVDGLGPVLQIAEGWSVELPDKVAEAVDKRTDKTWPTTWFVPRLTSHEAFDSVYSVMANWGANHGALCYGHIGAELITLASMLRIPVCMHNVSKERIFRPTAWASFGMDKESADFKACATYGPLYK